MSYFSQTTAISSVQKSVLQTTTIIQLNMEHKKLLWALGQKICSVFVFEYAEKFLERYYTHMFTFLFKVSPRTTI